LRPRAFLSSPAAVEFAGRETRALCINEVLARNDSLTGTAYLDEDGTRQGWLELYNPGPEPMALAGYRLGGGTGGTALWPLPDRTVKPGGLLVVWGSGKDRRGPCGELHASFTFMGSETIFLVDPDGVLAGSCHVGGLPADHSFGRAGDGAGAWGFYAALTPGSSNGAGAILPFLIGRRHVSLTVGQPYRLAVIPGHDVVWESDNPLVDVGDDGTITAAEDAIGEHARATITARSVRGDHGDSCDVTIVGWKANRSELTVVDTPGADHVLACVGEATYFTKGRELHVSEDGLRTSRRISTFPRNVWNPTLLVTPFGYFLRGSEYIYRSDDLREWTTTVKLRSGGLRHSFACDYDDVARTGYVYACEYSAGEPANRHAVYRGTFPPDGSPQWDMVLEFASLDEYDADRTLLTAVRHIHVLAVDPYTGDLWVGTGDRDVHCRLYCSTDRGETFRIVGMGSQAWRTLSVWFTERYVYWNMDTSKPQSVWRIPRSRCAGVWPSITAELTSGRTRAVISYYVTRSDSSGHFPAEVGEVYGEDRPRSLSDRYRARLLNDPAFDYREEVAVLDNGSHWYHAWVKDQTGDDLVLLCAAAEGAIRDGRGRVFGIKERADGTCDVQELLSVPSSRTDSRAKYVMVEPRVQDAAGYIYLLGRYTAHTIYTASLRWVDRP
jgi:hypothetical protein